MKDQNQTKPTSTIDEILQERGSRYGRFKTHAEISQSLKWILIRIEKWHKLESDQKEALEMIMHKIGRIMNGDPNYSDSWRDIAGYAELVANRLDGKVL